MNFDKFRYEFAINSGIERFVVVEFQCYTILISAPPGFSKYPNVTVKFQKAILNFNKTMFSIRPPTSGMIYF